MADEYVDNVDCPYSEGCGARETANGATDSNSKCTIVSENLCCVHDLSRSPGAFAVKCPHCPTANGLEANSCMFGIDSNSWLLARILWTCLVSVALHKHAVSLCTEW